MPIERAVRKLTGEPADMFGFVGRGYVREGDWADLCVFDPETVAPGPIRRVRDFPADGERLTAEEPTGIRHVLVNGTPIRRDEVQLDTTLRPGMRPESRMRSSSTPTCAGAPASASRRHRRLPRSPTTATRWCSCDDVPVELETAVRETEQLCPTHAITVS